MEPQGHRWSRATKESDDDEPTEQQHRKRRRKHHRRHWDVSWDSAATAGRSSPDSERLMVMAHRNKIHQLRGSLTDSWWMKIKLTSPELRWTPECSWNAALVITGKNYGRREEPWTWFNGFRLMVLTPALGAASHPTGVRSMGPLLAPSSKWTRNRTRYRVYQVRLKARPRVCLWRRRWCFRNPVGPWWRWRPERWTPERWTPERDEHQRDEHQREMNTREEQSVEDGQLSSASRL